MLHGVVPFTRSRSRRVRRSRWTGARPHAPPQVRLIPSASNDGGRGQTPRGARTGICFSAWGVTTCAGRSTTPTDDAPTVGPVAVPTSHVVVHGSVKSQLCSVVGPTPCRSACAAGPQSINTSVASTPMTAVRRRFPSGLRAGIECAFMARQFYRAVPGQTLGTMAPATRSTTGRGTATLRAAPPRTQRTPPHRGGDGAGSRVEPVETWFRPVQPSGFFSEVRAVWRPAGVAPVSVVPSASLAAKSSARFSRRFSARLADTFSLRRSART